MWRTVNRTSSGIIAGRADALVYVKGDQSRGEAHVVKLDDLQHWEQGSGWPNPRLRGLN